MSQKPEVSKVKLRIFPNLPIPTIIIPEFEPHRWFIVFAEPPDLEAGYRYSMKK